MLTNAHISCIYFFLIGLIVYEIRQVATLPAWPHYPYFPYNVLISLIVLISYYSLFISIRMLSLANIYTLYFRLYFRLCTYVFG